MTARGRAKTALVGVAERALGVAPPGVTAVDIIGEAITGALADCGLSLVDVDGLCVATTDLPMGLLDVAGYLRLRPRYLDGTQIGGSSFVSQMNRARMAIEAGECRVAVIAHATMGRTLGRAVTVANRPDPYEAPYRPMLPIAAYALAASRHMAQFGTTEEQLAAVAVAARSWAAHHPDAWHRDPLTVEDVLASRPIADPLKLRDCCLISDGGSAVVLVGTELARELRHDPVYLLGVGEAISHRHISYMPDLTTTVARESGERAFAMAGLRPDDIDVAELYDAFTINPILFLEDLGFCAKGDGGSFVMDGRIAFGGEFPVNTNGGGLSYHHTGMYGLLMLVEAVRQLRDEAGERQVARAHTALVHTNGGVLSSQCTAILGRPETVT